MSNHCLRADSWRVCESCRTKNKNLLSLRLHMIISCWIGRSAESTNVLWSLSACSYLRNCWLSNSACPPTPRLPPPVAIQWPKSSLDAVKSLKLAMPPLKIDKQHPTVYRRLQTKAPWVIHWRGGLDVWVSAPLLLRMLTWRKWYSVCQLMTSAQKCRLCTSRCWCFRVLLVSWSSSDFCFWCSFML